MPRFTRLPKLRVAITNKCQLRCSFCGGADYAMENFQPARLRDNPLSRARLLSIIAAYVEAGGKYVQFTGGEPLIARDIANVVRSVRSVGGIPEINSNGVALTPQKAAELADAGLGTLKVSIPSFVPNTYARVTGRDWLGRVLRNIDHATETLTIRINTVALRSQLSEIPAAIRTCREHGIHQLLYLELLHYYDESTASGDFYSREHVARGDLQALIGRELGGRFDSYGFYPEYENPLEFCESPTDGFQAFTKYATTSVRLSACGSCPVYCQEGVYELRLSTGGYLTVCNTVNSLGRDLSSVSDDFLLAVFNRYLRLLNQEATVASDRVFVDKIGSHATASSGAV